MSAVSLLGALLGGLLGGLLVGGLYERLPVGLAFGLLFGLLFGLAGGLVSGLMRGGASYLRHRLLVLLLRRQELIPADLIGFLDYADSRILLRRAGGGYLFIHRLLQEHFANRIQQTDSAHATAKRQAVWVQ